MKARDLTGMKFGHRTVLKIDENRRYHWICRCDCGETRSIAAGDLRRKSRPGSRACRACSKKFSKHGQYKSPEYRAWASMISRCRNETHTGYKNYGGKGISVDPIFLGDNGFINFLSEVGKKPDGLTLDRIDNNQGYKPGNLRWATLEQQNRNRSNNKWLIYEGQKFCLKDVGKFTPISWRRLAHQIYYHELPPQEAFNKLIQQRVD